MNSQHRYRSEGVNRSMPLFLLADSAEDFSDDVHILPAHGVQHEPGRHSGGPLRETTGVAEDG